MFSPFLVDDNLSLVSLSLFVVVGTFEDLSLVFLSSFVVVDTFDDLHLPDSEVLLVICLSFVVCFVFAVLEKFVVGGGCGEEIKELVSLAFVLRPWEAAGDCLFAEPAAFFSLVCWS